MKFCLKYFIAIVLLPFICLGLNYNVPYTDTAPTLDGVLSAGEWDGAMQILMSYPDIVTSPKEGAINSATVVPDSDADLSARWYFMWDEDALYIAVRVWDDELYWLIERGAGNYSQDGAQLLFNFKNNSAATYQDAAAIIDFAPRTATDAQPDIYERFGSYYGLDNAAIASSIYNNEGYFMEVSLPWMDFDEDYSPLDYPAGDPNNVHGAGLVLLDYDGPLITSPGSTIMADFGRGVYTASTPSTWNTITLVDELVCGDFGMLSADLNDDCVVDLNDFAILAAYWLKE